MGQDVMVYFHCACLLGELKGDVDCWNLIVYYLELVVIPKGNKWLNKGIAPDGLLQECNLTVFNKVEGMGEQGKTCQSHAHHS